MDPLVEAYRSIQRNAKDVLNEESGRHYTNKLNKALQEFYFTAKEMKGFDVDEDVLDGMYEQIKKVVEDWKILVQHRTAA